MHNVSITRAVRLALASAATASLANAPVLAQDQAEAEPAANVGTVVVTGSRIKQPNLTSISPVTAVGADSIKLEGVTRVEDLINNLPQAFADFGSTISNGATGAATVNLRGLGSQRTLVLVNGRRLMPGDPQQNGVSAPDLNQIPGALIERVEVLTGGASAVYGADAVAGVVNFIMNDDFEGVRLDAQYGFYEHDNSSSVGEIVEAQGFQTPDSNVRDGYSTDVTFMLGVNTGDGRGNATVYAGYREIDALLQSQRDYSACTLGSGAAFSCSGSGTTSPARFIPVNPANGLAAGDFTLDPGSALIPYSSALHAYNFGALSYYQRPDERYTAGLFAHYEASPRFDAYTEFMFMNDESISQVAPSGLFLGAPRNVNCDNPLMTAEQRQTFCTDLGLGPTDVASIIIGKRNVEGGGRQDHLQHTSFRAVIGARGALSDAWSYDLYGQHGTTEFEQHFIRDFSDNRSANALIAVDDGAGNVVCGINADADPNNDDNACVPYNIFQIGGVTQDALGYVQGSGFAVGSTTEEIVSGSVTGDLGVHGVKLPWASDGLAVAFGAEYRSEESELRNDEAFASGDLLGQGGPQLNIIGSFDVSEVFAEARMPLVQDKPFAQVVSLEAGYRYSDYSLGFDTETYKFGADWAPSDDLRFRGSYQRAVRSPNVVELFRPSAVQNDGTTDPCAGAIDPATGLVPSGRTLEECARSGVTAGQYGFIIPNSAGQYQGLTGGEATLQPESSDTYSFGLVFTPSFLSGFSVSVDYFDIDVGNRIGTYGADLILNTCLSGGEAQWCDLVHRARQSGSIWLGPDGYVIDLNVNTGAFQTKGIDVEANYGVDIGNRAGRFGFQLIGTMVDELMIEPASGGPTYDCVGLYGAVCGTPTPEWRHKFRTTWYSPWNLDLTLTWRYIDAVAVDASSSNPQLAGPVPATDAKLDSQSYLDLVAAYSFVTAPANLTFRLGINNLTDQDPPLIGQSNCPGTYCNGNTFPQVYDSLGRTVFLNMTADF